MFIYNYFTNNDFTIYGRNKSNDSYKLLFTIDEGNPMSRFKHEVYAFSLAKYDYKDDTKCIYLYKGNERIAKALFDRETEQVTIWSSMIREWIKSEELLPKLRYPIQETNFFRALHAKFAWMNSQTITFVKKDK